MLKNYHALILLLLISPFWAIGQTTSIYDIQFTTNPGNDGTYPSPMEGQIVTAGGIVTATDYNNENYFIASSAGGAWNGIFIYDDFYSPAIGDSVILKGEVYEYNGLTELKDLQWLNIISSGNPLPLPEFISTQDVQSQEAYESVFVEINDVTVSEEYNQWGDWQVNDGSGSCYISSGFYDFADSGFPLMMGYPFESIRGLVSFNYDEYRLHPRGIDDLETTPDQVFLSIGDYFIYTVEEFEVSVDLSILNQPSTCNVYALQVDYDPEILEYAGFDASSTLSENGDVDDQSTPGNVNLEFDGAFDFNGIETLIKLKFLPVSSGNTTLEIFSSTINNSPVNFTSFGSVNASLEAIPIGDTLTIIQRPIQNIPVIAVPGDTIPILCHAAETITNWQASLEFGPMEVDLEITATEFNSDIQIWNLHTIVPEVEIFELYNLRVTASDGVSDVTKNAVQLIPAFKDNFYFAHITDTHLPTHYFYEDPESVYDTSEMQDLREIINDINILRPEFVLLTGDFINEGELEDFENRRNHTKAQRILSEFEVPVFLVSGNHDLGGWDETPPPQGTSRNEWWRFFGWSWLKNPGTNQTYTQDYSFDYGPVHFTGLESYINYDGYMYGVYGNESFIPSQLQWLVNDLDNAANSETQVLFYHKDFDNQLDLESLDVDMALWGHVHSNNGSIYVPPFDLSTAAACDGNRAFRIIDVNDGELQPYETVYAGYSGESFAVEFSSANNGSSDTVIANIINDYSIDFYNALLKFEMPSGDLNYVVENGELQQVINAGDMAICYVKASVPASGNLQVNVIAKASSGITESATASDFEVYQCYPNPFYSETTIRFQNRKPEKVTVSVYDLSGRLVARLLDSRVSEGIHNVHWDGKTESGKEISGNIFFVKVNTESGFSKVVRLVKL